MRRVVAATVLACLLTGTGAAVAATPPETPPFSAARDDVSVMLWLRRNTSLRLGESVVFSPESVLVVVSDVVDTSSPWLHRVSFRQEATNIDFVSRTGGRSIRGVADVDCGTGRVRASMISLYSGSDLRGDQIFSQGVDVEWRAPVYGTASALVMSEVCRQKRPASVVAAAVPPPPLPRPVAPPAPPRPPAPTPAARPVRPPPPRPPAPAPAPHPSEDMTLAQIGAFGSRAAAEAAWSKLSETYPALLSGKTVRIEAAVISGAEMFRTSIQGFPSETAARAACAELMSRSQACFVRKAP